MAFAKSLSMRWGIIVLCLLLGTWFGIFMQRFPATAQLFTNVVDFSVDIREIDIIMVRFGFLFAMKLNLGTLIGGIVGIWAAR